MSAINVKQFVDFITKEGVARPNKFEIVLTLPAAVKKLTGKNDDRISMMAQTVSMPGYNASIVEVKENRLLRKVPFEKTTGELDITFVATEGMTEKAIFDVWNSHMFKPNHRVEYYDNIIGNLEVRKLDSRTDQVVHTTKISEIYPITITPINLDRTMANSLLTFQVTFAYYRIYQDGEDELAQSVIPAIDNIISGIGAAVGTGITSSFVIPGLDPASMANKYAARLINDAVGKMINKVSNDHMRLILSRMRAEFIKGDLSATDAANLGQYIDILIGGLEKK